MIDGCQTNVKWCDIGLNCLEPGVMRLGIWTDPVSWQRGQAGLEGSTVIHGRISTCNVAEVPETTGTDKVGEWWLSFGGRIYETGDKDWRYTRVNLRRYKNVAR